jgi:hypothetical protein
MIPLCDASDDDDTSDVCASRDVSGDIDDTAMMRGTC